MTDLQQLVTVKLLELAAHESGRFLVVGLVVNDPVAPVRWASIYEATTARQAEDFAREEVHEEVVDGIHGKLHVAGVYQISIDIEGDPIAQITRADKYARYADPEIA